MISKFVAESSYKYWFSEQLEDDVDQFFELTNKSTTNFIILSKFQWISFSNTIYPTLEKENAFMNIFDTLPLTALTFTG